MSTCGEVGSDVHALIKELAIRRVEHRLETHSKESQHLAEGTGEARLRWRFSFALQQALSFHKRDHLCKQGVALGSTRQLCLQGPVSVHAHCTERVTGSKGREGANRVGRGIGVGGGNGDGNGVGGGNGDVNGDGDGVGAGTGTGTGARVEVNEGLQNGNGDGSRDGAGTGTGTGVETRRRTQDGDGDGDGDGNKNSSGDETGEEYRDGNADRIGEGGREAKKRKKPHQRCKRNVGKGGDLGGKRKICRKERVDPAAADPDNLENNKEALGVAKGAQGFNKNWTSRESVSPLSRLIRGFCSKCH